MRVGVTPPPTLGSERMGGEERKTQEFANTNTHMHTPSNLHGHRDISRYNTNANKSRPTLI